MTSGNKSFLDGLSINTNSDPSDRRSLTRQEAFVLGWLIHNTKGRTYKKMMRDCMLTLEQCQTAVLGLIEIDLLRSS